MATYIITDIHGCLQTFRELLWKCVQLKKTDSLYLLGDYTDKGPDSKGVLDEILKLKDEQYQLTVLRGNHDQMLLDAFAGKDLESWRTDLEMQLTLESFGVRTPQEVPMRYVELILRMPYYHVLRDYYLVHAGFNFKKKRTLDDTYSMMNKKKYKVKTKALGGRGVIHGHRATSLQDVRQQLSENSIRQNLDAGCVYYKNEDEGMGNLVALHLESKELLIQPNIDQPYAIHRKI